MAAKIGGVDLSAATAANIHTAGINGGTYVVHMTNRGSVTATVSLGVSSTSDTLENAHVLVHELRLAPGESRSFGKIVCDGTDKYIVGLSDVVNVNMSAQGHDE